MTLTQSERIYRFLLDYPGATVMDIQLRCRPFISNPRARISDVRKELRAIGGDVVCRKRGDGYDGFWIVEPRPVTAGEQIGLAL